MNKAKDKNRRTEAQIQQRLMAYTDHRETVLKIHELVAELQHSVPEAYLSVTRRHMDDGSYIPYLTMHDDGDDPVDMEFVEEQGEGLVDVAVTTDKEIVSEEFQVRLMDYARTLPDGENIFVLLYPIAD